MFSGYGEQRVEKPGTVSAAGLSGECRAKRDASPAEERSTTVLTSNYTLSAEDIHHEHDVEISG